MAIPPDGCKKLNPPPTNDTDDPDFIRSEGYPLAFGVYDDDDDGLLAPKKLGWIALVSRYGCSFEVKVFF
jgi:hypothetical protein